MEFDIRVDPTITTADGLATPTDIQAFSDGPLEELDGDGMTYAIMDTGIADEHPIFEHVDVEHPDIPGLPTDGEDDVGHGTGAAAWYVLNSPNLKKLIDVPIFGDSGRTGIQQIIAGYEWLTSNVDRYDRVNMSWGANRKIDQIDRMHNELEQAGGEAVVAAGNTDQQTGSPATAERAFAVAACTLDGRMTSFSSPTDDLAAPGRDIALPKAPGTQMGPDVPRSQFDEIMEDIGGPWIKASGTSFSAPIAGGYSGSFSTRVRSLEGGYGPDIEEKYELAFLDTAEDIKGTGEDGQGYLQFRAALEHPGEPEPPEPPEPVEGSANIAQFGEYDGVLFYGDIIPSSLPSTVIARRVSEDPVTVELEDE